MSQRKPMSGKVGKAGQKARGANRRRKRSPKDGFSDFMDLAEDQDFPEADVPPAAGNGATAGPSHVAREGAASAATIGGAGRNQAPGWAWGLVPALCTLCVGGALASALNFLYGGRWNVLWDFSGLTSLEGFLNLNAHPQNVFLVVVAIGLVLLLMVGIRLAGAIGDLKSRAEAQGELLGRLTSLRFDDQEAWQDPLFKMHPAVETFTAEILGAWRHQEVRMARLVGLEGECHRLEKALSNESREDLTSKFEIPVVGMIADEVVQLFDARDAALEDQESRQAKLGSRGHDLMADVHDARGWQRFTQDQLNLQGEAVLKASAHLHAAGSQLERDPRYAWKPGELLPLLKELRAKIQSGGPVPAAKPADRDADTDLLDRLSKLSFQIGMEVARLGNRGERLAPMAQTLEEVAKAVRAQGGGGGQPGEVPADLRRKLAEQIARLEKAAVRPERNLPQLVLKLGEATRDAGNNLTKIADSFESQYDRLGRMGTACAEITGVDFDAGQVTESSAGDLELSNFDPFLRQEPEEDIPVIDPFLERSDSITVTEGGLDPFAISNNVLPGSENEFARSAPAETGLPDSAEKVYDLAEFGAVKLPADSPVGGDGVHDLSDFGAVSLEPTPGGDEVHDLSDFGAIPLEYASGEDRIHDLSEFGARRLD